MGKRITDLFNNRSLVQKQVIFFMLVAFSIIAIFSTYFYYYSREAIISRTYDQLTAIRETRKNQVEYLIADKIANLRFLTKSPIITSLPESGAHGPGATTPLQINALGLEELGVTGVYIAGTNNRLLASGHSSTNHHTSLPDTLLSALLERAEANDSVIVSDFFHPEGDSTSTSILFIFPCEHPGNMACDSAMIIYEIPATLITSALLEYSAEKGFGNTGEAYLVGADRLMRSESRFIEGATLRIGVHSEAASRALQGEDGAIITTDYRGVKVYSSFAPLDIYGLRWAILSEIDYREAMKSITAMRNDIIFLTVVITLFILAISILLAYRIVNPIKRLGKAVVSFGLGEEQIRDTNEANDEIGILARSFNIMAAQLSNKTAAIFHEQEIERQRISRELHDGLGQILAGIKLKLENLTDKTTIAGKEELLSGAKLNLVSAIDELHRISSNLRPPVLTELGLITALRNLCAEFEKDSGVACEISDFGDFADISPRIANYLYRICQEGLTNIAKHASASNVQLQTIENNEHYIVIVEDDGKGFTFTKSMLYKGNGLFNMHERVLLLGGKISIESAPGKGTTLRVKIPKTAASNT